MNAPFHDLSIAGLQEERCYRVEGSLVRLFLQLSEAPPVGWSYLFIRAWQSMAHPLERRVGIEGDVIWIECTPVELRENQLPELQAAITQANEHYWSARQRRIEASRRQNEQHRQMQAELAELADCLNPAPYKAAGDDSNAGACESRCGIAEMWRVLRDALRI
jgi:hypothetical protein